MRLIGRYQDNLQIWLLKNEKPIMTALGQRAEIREAETNIGRQLVSNQPVHFFFKKLTGEGPLTPQQCRGRQKCLPHRWEFHNGPLLICYTALRLDIALD